MRPVLSLLALPLALAAVSGPRLSGESAPESRAFRFTYEAALEGLPAGARSVRVWLPAASSDPAQSVAIEDVSSPVPPARTRDAEYGNPILYFDLSGRTESAARIAVTYRVTRRVFSGEPAGGVQTPPASRYLSADRLVPIGGRMKELADSIVAGRSERQEVARAIYDYVFRTLRYDKSGTGWGRGDAVWACDARRGNCTDFHSLFIALMRAEKIPARFEIGFPIPAGAHEGEIPGYHCWAEYLDLADRWIPVDISEAWRAPERHDFFFGHLDADRIRFSIGRDVRLDPPQAGGRLNYFVYPYAEVDGKPWDGIRRRFTFHDMTGAAAAGMP